MDIVFGEGCNSYSIDRLELGLEYPTATHEEAVKLGMFLRKCVYRLSAKEESTAFSGNKQRWGDNSNMAGKVYKSLPVSRLPGYMLKLVIRNYNVSFASLQNLEHRRIWVDHFCIMGHCCPK